MFNSVVENKGVHLHSLIERTGCDAHGVPEGVPCYYLPNNLSKEAHYVGACGSRVKKAGYNLSQCARRLPLSERTALLSRSSRSPPFTPPGISRSKDPNEVRTKLYYAPRSTLCSEG
jgi:hypothetical protein